MYEAGARLVAQYFVFEDGGDVFNCAGPFHGNEAGPPTKVTYNDEDMGIAVGLKSCLIDIHGEDVAGVVTSELDTCFVRAMTRHLSMHTCAALGDVVPDTAP